MHKIHAFRVWHAVPCWRLYEFHDGLPGLAPARRSFEIGSLCRILTSDSEE